VNRNNVRLAVALVVSGLVHGLLLGLVLRERPALSVARAMPTIPVNLVRVAAPPLVEIVASEVPPKPVAVPTKRAATPRATKAVEKPPELVAASPVAAIQKSKPTASTDDVTSVEQYRMVLSFALARHGHSAKGETSGTRNLRTVIRISIAASGRTHAIDIHRSSGDPDVDDRARTLVAEALTQTPVPFALLGFTFLLDLTIVTATE
jgi:hypothetical protein